MDNWTRGGGCVLDPPPTPTPTPATPTPTGLSNWRHWQNTVPKTKKDEHTNINMNLNMNLKILYFCRSQIYHLQPTQIADEQAWQVRNGDAKNPRMQTR
jgi:hypothetical protein